MGLLDTVLGAVLNGQQQNNASSNAQGGMGGMGGLGGMNMAALIPVLAPMLMNMLSNSGSHGGLGGLAEKFNQAGLGNVMNSWVGTGQNQAINGDQLTQVLGHDTVSDMASKLGMSHGDTAGALSQILPGLIDQLTPHGQVPSGGVGNGADLMGMLGSLLQHR